MGAGSNGRTCHGFSETFSKAMQLPWKPVPDLAASCVQAPGFAVASHDDTVQERLLFDAAALT